MSPPRHWLHGTQLELWWRLGELVGQRLESLGHRASSHAARPVRPPAHSCRGSRQDTAFNRVDLQVKLDGEVCDAPLFGRRWRDRAGWCAERQNDGAGGFRKVADEEGQISLNLPGGWLLPLLSLFPPRLNPAASDTRYRCRGSSTARWSVFRSASREAKAEAARSAAAGAGPPAVRAGRCCQKVCSVLSARAHAL